MRLKTKILYIFSILFFPVTFFFLPTQPQKPVEVEQVKAQPIEQAVPPEPVEAVPPSEPVVEQQQALASQPVQTYNPPIVQAPPVSQGPGGDEGQIFALHNEYRQQHGLSTLTYDYNLGLSAQEKAEDLCNNQYWSHNRPNGETPWVVISKYSSFSSAGENLARGFNDPSDVMNGWYNSPTHLANIVGNWQMVGVGWYACPVDGLTYVAAHFKLP